jgi:hypothetical protein
MLGLLHMPLMACRSSTAMTAAQAERLVQQQIGQS